ncbi:ROK family protein [Dehalogenimonas lykanthroporepellens BL-DC-9]|jgi:glucokinase|nr:ROK family protein [Dehalogenimonas lykanthroporepellens BL-DC-9]
MKNAAPILVADLGGTKVLAGAVGEGNRLEYRVRRGSAGAGSQDEILTNLYGALTEVAAAMPEPPQAVAVASAGAIDLAAGVVTHSPNMMAVNGLPLRTMISEKYGLPTVLLNDASAAALAEHRLGAGRGCRDMIFLTVSTGIGGGIIIDGRLYQGIDGTAGEFGHTVIDRHGEPDTCGARGCLEQYASGTAIARRAKQLLDAGRRSELEAGRDRLSAADVADAAARGDALATEVFDEALQALGLGLVSIVNVFNPEVIVIGGGVSGTGSQLFEPVRRMVAEHAYQLPARRVSIVPAELGDEAGVIGAALYAREELS